MITHKSITTWSNFSSKPIIFNEIEFNLRLLIGISLKSSWKKFLKEIHKPKIEIKVLSLAKNNKIGLLLLSRKNNIRKNQQDDVDNLQGKEAKPLKLKSQKETISHFPIGSTASIPHKSIHSIFPKSPYK